MSSITRRQFATTATLAMVATALPACRNAGPSAAGSDDIIGLTGAAGRLGRVVVDELLKTVPASRIVAVARNREEQTDDIAAKSVTLRFADYDYPEQLVEAFDGIDRLLLISSSGGQRVRQHQAVITAAKERGVGFIAYTSLLRAATSPLAVRADHAATEEILAGAGLPYAVLRNGWYTENYDGDVATAIQTGEFVGATGEGRISAAARADYAAAAAAVLTADDDPPRRIHELAGDEGFTMAEFAAEIARQSGRPVVYRDLSEAEYRAWLIARGTQEATAANLTAMQLAVAGGALFDDSRQLSQLIGRPTTPWQQTVASAVAELAGRSSA